MKQTIKRAGLFKYIDAMMLLLILFVAFFAFLIYNLFSINERIKNFGEIQNSINELKILDSQFDALLANKAVFINYDDTVAKVKLFERYLEALNDESIYGDFGVGIRKVRGEVSDMWESKSLQIERFKSHNAAMLGSLNYLGELSKKIKENYIFEDYKSAYVLDSALNDLLKLFLNIELSKEVFEKNLATLDNLKKRYESSDLNFFYIKYEATINEAFGLNEIKKKYADIDLKSALGRFENGISKAYDKNINSQKNTAFTFFAISSLLLIFLFYMFLKSIRTKKELASFRYAVENSDNAIVITDKNRKIKYVNEAFEKITGYKREEILGKNPSILKSGKMSSEFYKKMNDILNDGKKWNGEFINVDKNGDIYYETASITPLLEDGDITGYLAIKLDVTDYIRQQERVEFLAYHDSLTMLPNRRSLEKEIEKALEFAKRSRGALAIFFIDLDGFKTINDALGHDMGDLLLVEVANRFKASLREYDEVFRIGGDEFAVLIRYAKENDSLEQIAAKLINIANEPILIKTHTLHVGCSIGISRYPNDGEDFVTLLKHSDIAMYKAKQEGKNRFEYYDVQLSSSVHTRLNIEQALARALENNEFYLVYQPKYDLKTQTICSLEALLRWDSSSLGSVEPANFISVAEECGMINKIGLFVFKKACEDFVAVKDRLPNLQLITINISTAQLSDKAFVGNILEAVREVGISTKNIGLEITETHVMKNINEVSSALSKLRELGFKIIIDDFGSGYSSMHYLQKLPIDTLKINRAFVNDLTSNPGNMTIIKAIVAISKNFGYDTVASGIESKEQESSLAELNVDFGQGFLFSKPKKINEL